MPHLRVALWFWEWGYHMRERRSFVLNFLFCGTHEGRTYLVICATAHTEWDLSILIRIRILLSLVVDHLLLLFFYVACTFLYCIVPLRMIYFCTSSSDFFSSFLSNQPVISIIQFSKIFSTLGNVYWMLLIEGNSKFTTVYYCFMCMFLTGFISQQVYR